MNFPRIGVAAVVRIEDHFLIGRRNGTHGPGTWGMPGGALELGETIQACALRETLEETGLKVRPYDPGAVFTEVVFPDGQHWVTHFVPCEWRGGNPEIMEPDKMAEWRWVKWSTIPEPIFLPLEKLLEHPQLGLLTSGRHRGVDKQA